jgi:heme/copper-type cytochrome/quinol oxidase subunit 2
MNDENNTPSFWQVVKSVLAGMLGVQSAENRERDFQHGKFSAYVFVAFIVVLVFILTIIAVVKTVMHFAGV